MAPSQIGTLSRWIEERGFGFITPKAGGEDVFVHISALPRGSRPEIGTTVSFEMETAPDGRRRAVRLRLPQTLALEPVERHRPSSRPHTEHHSPRPAHAPRSHDARPRRQNSSLPRRALVLAIAATAAYAGATWFQERNAFAPPAAERAATRPQSSREPAQAAASPFQCDGRIHCSQMRSCDEAKFFIRNCPGTQMDGDRDGVPCESQWCRGW